MGENRLIFGASIGDYHADRLCDGPTLSSSIAHKIVAGSPAHAFEAHPKLGGKSDGSDADEEIEVDDDEPAEKSRKKTLGGGTVLHALVLGRGHEGIEVIPADVLAKNGAMSTKEARARKLAAEAAGKVAIAAPKWGKYERAAEGIKASLAAFEIEIDPKCAEVVMLWVEVADDGTEVQCRALLDHVSLTPVWGTIDDLKTGVTAHPKALPSKIVSLGADIQAAAYRSGLAKVKPEIAGFIEYRWLFVEPTPPYAVTPAKPNGELQTLGDAKWRLAVNTWARCFKDGHWPSYTETPIAVGPPPWALKDFIEAQIAAGFSPEDFDE